LRGAAVFAGAVVLAVIIGAQMGLFSGSRPDNLGVRDGRLAPPRDTPNNVSSQVDKAADPVHAIEPLRYSGEAARAWTALRKVVDGMERARVVNSGSHYLQVEFTTRLMGFVDDAEFCLDEKAGVIHVRSASRLGRSDFGVNRARIEAMRKKLAGMAA
jgi:uncharacterized protein (DUF1499 family)